MDRVEIGNDDFKIVTIQKEDSGRVVRFLRNFFFVDEPLNVCARLVDDSLSTSIDLEEYCQQSLSEGVSVMAVSPSDETDILGVCVNGITSRREKRPEKAFRYSNPNFVKILNLLSKVSKEWDIFTEIPDVKWVLEIKIVSVDKAMRGRGIAKALINKSKLLAKEELGLGAMIRADCTSVYSAKAFSRMGFQRVYSLMYSDHLDEFGEAIFFPEPPHESVQTFVWPPLHSFHSEHTKKGIASQ